MCVFVRTSDDDDDGNDDDHDDDDFQWEWGELCVPNDLV